MECRENIGGWHRWLIGVHAGLLLMALGLSSTSARQTISLNGEWFFRRDGSGTNQWKAVTVPSSFEQHEGFEFNGVGWYRRSLPGFELLPGQRVLLHFQAAATEAEVWCDGWRLGAHLGGWTPFRFDITDLLRRGQPGQPHEVQVRVDEKVGHNTQGFLPIIAPHFGGLWQDVALVLVPETYIDDLALLSVGEVEPSEVRLTLPLGGTIPASLSNLSLRARLLGSQPWQDLVVRQEYSNGLVTVRAPLESPRRWSPANPNLYELDITMPGPDGDRIYPRAAFRSVEIFGPQIRLNDQPLQIRGLLNWGYSPPLVAPNPGEARWKTELGFARRRGFNLMKFCLWIPPRRYLELADEFGLMTWMEYPTWHPQLTASYREALEREFREFFQYDRNHPSVVLRSLTCETGPGADLNVIQHLYDLAHATIPGAIVEDDSSWIGWNRIHDFYDDHPYGNNDTWVHRLHGFNDHILKHGLKPLVLGECMAADTWIPREEMLAKLGSERPWWAPGPLDETGHWLDQMRRLYGASGLDSLGADSWRYGLLMRKYQIEALRREIPYGGYVVSVIRDVPNASMGLIDYLGQPKGSEADWAWHGDSMCLLKTEGDRRSFRTAEPLRAQVLLSHFGNVAIERGEAEITLEDVSQGNRVLQRVQVDNIGQKTATLAKLADLAWGLPVSNDPQPLAIRVRLKSNRGVVENYWPIYSVPPLTNSGPLCFHSSLKADLREALFGATASQSDTNAVMVAARFDDELAGFLERGGRVLLLPDGETHSLPLNDHWFLRGAPYLPPHVLAAKVPRNLLLDLQHFDLASPVIPELTYLDEIDPLLLLWDTHDLKTVKTHGLIFETRVGEGRLLVSAVRHRGPNNAAGDWLLQVLLDHLSHSPPPRHALTAARWDYLKNKLQAEQTNLTAVPWQFKPDPKDEGLAQGWHLPRLASEVGWRPIRVGAAWESQGYPTLDGWAWYRVQVDIPRPWRGREVFLTFEGVDDIYELYVNGKLAGKGGDLATRKDAFNERKSHSLSRWVEPGKPALLVVRVHDWYGAGGIFRPVTLGTLSLAPGMDMLK